MIERLAHECEEFVSHGCFTSAHKLIEGLIDDPKRTARVHPLGFVYFDLGTLDRHRYRLHIWSPSHRSLQSVNAMVHDHIFGIRSRCMLGTLQNDTYLATPSPKGRYHLHTVQYEEDTSQMTNTRESWSASVAESVLLSSGESYTLDAGVFHFTKILDGEFCATALITTYGDEPGQPRVLIPKGSAPDGVYHRRSLRREASLSVVAEVRSRLPGRL